MRLIECRTFHMILWYWQRVKVVESVFPVILHLGLYLHHLLWNTPGWCQTSLLCSGSRKSNSTCSRAMDQIDIQLQRFLAGEQQKQQFQQNVHNMTDNCWDTCVGVPSQKLDRRTEGCIVNCVERFIDTSKFVVNRLEKEGESYIQKEAEALGSSSDTFKWQWSPDHWLFTHLPSC